MLAFAFLLLQVVLGDLAPLYTQEKPVHRNGLRSYIVIFNDGAPKFEGKEHIQKWLSSEAPSVSPTEVENVYDMATFRGFAAFLDDSGLTELRNHGFVKYIEEDAQVQLDAFTDRQDWGQIRVNQRANNLSTNSAQYSYSSGYPNQNLDITVWNFLSGIQALVNGDGSRATVCVVDTGCRSTHQEIRGRVDGNISYVAGQTTDGNGHGTHVAGSCCGAYRGMARATRITWAKVLSDSGSGTNANVISGINWCANRNNDATRTWIISLSLGGAQATTVNDAIESAARSGSVPVVAAGNENTDACTRSPASAPSAITVAASDKDDTKASFSNVGTCVNIWAPGVSIHSAWYTSDTAYNTISGTSMATPLVSGLVAALATNALNRAGAMQALQSRGVSGVIKQCPANTPNLLASTGRTP